MILTLFFASVFVLTASVIAFILNRRRPTVPTQPKFDYPKQINRADFSEPNKPWLIVLFTSLTCDSCQDLAIKAQPLASSDVEVQEVEFSANRELHARYQIDAVPTVVIADRMGVVHNGFVGPISATDLWATVAKLRELPINH